MCDLSVVKEFPQLTAMKQCVVGALIVKGFNFMHNRYTTVKKVQIFFKNKLNCTK
jgi:hypothetical protein